MVELGALRDGEHESHVSAHEEGERPGFEQIAETEGVAVEGDRRLQILGVDGDLADVLDRSASALPSR